MTGFWTCRLLVQIAFRSYEGMFHLFARTLINRHPGSRSLLITISQLGKHSWSYVCSVNAFLIALISRKSGNSTASGTETRWQRFGASSMVARASFYLVNLSCLRFCPFPIERTALYPTLDFRVILHTRLPNATWPKALAVSSASASRERHQKNRKSLGQK